MGEPGIKQFMDGKFSPLPGENIDPDKIDKATKRLEYEKGLAKETPVYNMDDYRKNPISQNEGDKNEKIKKQLDLETAKEKLVALEADLKRLDDQKESKDITSEYGKMFFEKMKTLSEEINEAEVDVKRREKELGL